ncbi:MAG: glucose-1-phosphate adenylyltransferase [Planctomycetota bacterium]|nr:MAG: glucose-1-phosphate adenylyltransferase [Planctomycetota bacterium]
MTPSQQTIAIVLGGGRGTRLDPLTRERAKPAVSLAGRYRLVDIPISNCLHSDIDRIFILTQYASGSLNRHIIRTYRFDPFGHGFVEILAAQQHEDRERGGWFQGTADAVRRNLNEFLQLPAEHYLVLAGDQLYRMDFRELLRTHIEAGADVTVAVTPVSEEQVPGLGIMRLGESGAIVEFVEKPQEPAEIERLRSEGLPPGKSHVASMGIYLIRRRCLRELLADESQTDFGKHVIPEAIRTRAVQAHVFEGYWEDIGTIRAFFEANLRLASARPSFDLYDRDHPFFTRQRHLPPSRHLGSVAVRDSLVAEGSTLEECTIEQSVIGIRSTVRRGAHLRRVVLIGHDGFRDPADAERPLEIGEGAVIENAIIDKNVTIGPGVELRNREGVRTAENPLFVVRDGIIVVPKGAVIPPGTRF